MVINQPASANYFQVVGVNAALGRASLGEAAGRPETVLGYRLWQTRFASDQHIVGKTVLLNRKAFLVAGVMPKAGRNEDLGQHGPLKSALRESETGEAFHPRLRVKRYFATCSLA
jgi:hypothetical protein